MSEPFTGSESEFPVKSELTLELLAEKLSELALRALEELVPSSEVESEVSELLSSLASLSS